MVDVSTLDVAALYATARQGEHAPGVTAFSFDPVTGALYLVFANPKKATLRVRGSHYQSVPGFTARLDVDAQGRALQMEIRPNVC